MTEPVKKDLRQLAIGLAVVAALCLIFAAFTKQWLVNSGRYTEIGFGLRENYQCSTSRGYGDEKAGAERCEGMSNAAMVEKVREMMGEAAAAKMTSKAFAPMGWLTLGLILVSALGLLGAAGLAAKKKTPELPIAPTSLALLGAMAGLLTGCVFVATKPGPPGMVGVGLSFWLFGIGCVMGIASAQMLAKLNRPPETEWAVD